ncbi:MAG TPA: hypothetical protein DEP66_01940 [Acidimicrobiaceae bacterium]|nr:hypothetical protein [Acidimicrobiaceae bacterium]HCB36995.1 hypothetical protein [Acidimicrobiaceae bacterium]
MDSSGQSEPEQSEPEELTFREAAIVAELETGRVEPTTQSAWLHALVRIVRISVAVVLLGLGGIMLALPGPGLLVIALGLGILARDVAWADRLLTKVRARLPTDSDGRLPRSTIVTMVLLGLAGISLSLAFTVGNVDPFFWRD